MGNREEALGSLAEPQPVVLTKGHVTILKNMDSSIGKVHARVDSYFFSLSNQVLFLSRPKTSIIIPNTFIAFTSKTTKTTNGRSTSTQPVLFVSRHSNLTTYDHKTHPQGPKTSIVSSNTSITFRFCCKLVFGVLLKIVKYLI